MLTKGMGDPMPIRPLEGQTPEANANLISRIIYVPLTSGSAAAAISSFPRGRGLL